jgi:hypothetical protein
MLREDATVGRWVRMQFPNQHGDILKRARIETQLRLKEMKRNVIIKANPSLREYPNA